MTDSPKFRDISGLALFVKLGMVVSLLLSLIHLWCNWMEIDILQRMTSGATVANAEIEANENGLMISSGLYFLTFLGIAFLFLRWTYFANQNARSLVASDMTFTPGWAIGWYFIPVASLWKPYQAIKETFKASNPEYRDDWSNASHPGILPIWWTLWIVGNIFGQIEHRLSLRAETQEELLWISQLSFISDVLGIPLGIAVIVLVGTLQEWQMEKRLLMEDVSVAHQPPEENLEDPWGYGTNVSGHLDS